MHAYVNKMCIGGDPDKWHTQSWSQDSSWYVCQIRCLGALSQVTHTHHMVGAYLCLSLQQVIQGLGTLFQIAFATLIHLLELSG